MQSPLPKSGRRRGPQPRAVPIVLTLALVIALAGAALSRAGARAGTAAARSVVCPRDDRHRLWPAQIRAGARIQLVPPGAATLTICGYNGINPSQHAPQFGLTGTGATRTARVIDEITSAIDSLKPATGIVNCPIDQRSQEVLTFSYPSGPPVVVAVDPGGCRQVDNGRLERLALGSPLATEVTALTTPVTGIRWPRVAGHLRLCGGPAPGRCFIENINGNDRILAVDSKGRWLAIAPVRGGRFSFTIARPGRYTFKLVAGRQVVKTRRQSVAMGRTTRVVFLIPVP